MMAAGVWIFDDVLHQQCAKFAAGVHEKLRTCALNLPRTRLPSLSRLVGELERRVPDREPWRNSLWGRIGAG